MDQPTTIIISLSNFQLFTKSSLIIIIILIHSMTNVTTTQAQLNNYKFPANDTNILPPTVSFPFPKLHIYDKYVEMDNGILQVTLLKPAGSVTGIKYNGVDNLLEALNGEFNRGYWDLVWIGNGSKGKKGSLDRLEATDFSVILENEEQIEISFTRTWNFSLQGKVVPLNIDKRYIMLRGSCGFYSYGIYEHLEGWPAFNLTNTRMAFKLRKDKFEYMAMADNRQRFMPLPDDREPERGQVLAYPEAVKLINPVEPQFTGEVDDKYEYSCENKDNRVHGWISNDPPIGFWQITPNDEFRSGGPQKQCLTSHVGPTNLAIFHSTHYSGEDLIMKFGEKEGWKKVYGPIFIYLNSLSDNLANPFTQLWEDAKQQSEDFPSSQQRGNLSGRLVIYDRYVSEERICANGAFVGLAAPGDVGSWQRESKGYQFWSKTDKDGYFSINDIRVGNYNIYAWVPGFIGDYRYDGVITITTDCYKEMGQLVYMPPRSGATLWEIGIPDRSAAEFYVPDPNPDYVNKLYVNHPDKFRQYGLWERYAELYPDEDLIYTVGVNDYSKDWFFAQVTRKIDDNTYKDSTWQIRFWLELRDVTQIYTLRIALATAHISELQVRVNEGGANIPLFRSGVIGKDNTIARHGIHGLYWVFNIDIPGSQLFQGNNTFFLTRTNSTTPFQGIMYDYIRLEAPPDFTH
ncbi:rhamnogalacturonate lyase B isoform X2 [Cannabis sativa]|uniref:rhamnogalacturonate lyase B isoform X2 n=1 Tax=Cannabis sativa TaxID=3483 RepID=UPI0029CA4B4F|nr:rhamnogalacturonate lyase B isoform X2 [Cannabis sativa]